MLPFPIQMLFQQTNSLLHLLNPFGLNLIVVRAFQKSYLSFDQVKVDGLMGRLNEFNNKIDEVAGRG